MLLIWKDGLRNPGSFSRGGSEGLDFKIAFKSREDESKDGEHASSSNESSTQRERSDAVSKSFRPLQLLLELRPDEGH